MTKSTKIDGRTLRSANDQIRDTLAEMRHPDLSDADLVKLALRIAAAHKLSQGDASDATILKTPNMPPARENDSEPLIDHMYFRIHAGQQRLAKRILQKAFSLDHLPQAQVTIDHMVFQASVYYVQRTACDRVATQFPEVFIASTPEKMAKPVGRREVTADEALEIAETVEPESSTTAELEQVIPSDALETPETEDQNDAEITEDESAEVAEETHEEFELEA